MTYHLGFKTGTLAALRQFNKNQASLIDNTFQKYDYDAFRWLPDTFDAMCPSCDPMRFYQYPVAELVLCHQYKPGCWENDHRLLDTTIHVASIPGSDDCMMGTTECVSIAKPNELHWIFNRAINGRVLDKHYVYVVYHARSRLYMYAAPVCKDGVDIPIPVDMTVTSGYVHPNRYKSEEAMSDITCYHLPVPFDDKYALDYQFRRLTGQGAEYSSSIIIFHGIAAAVDHMLNYARNRMYGANSPDGWITRWQERLAAILDAEKTARENNRKREQTYEEFVQSLPVNPWEKPKLKWLTKTAMTYIGLGILIVVIAIILAIEYKLYYC
jgi:hypothetical protein